MKSLAARNKSDPLKVVFWYNLAAKEGQKAASAPCSTLFRYSWRHPSVVPSTSTVDSYPVSIGDQVVVKPKDGKCTSRWPLGRVTGVTSANNVDIDGVPRHILDIRKLYGHGVNTEPAVEKEQDVRIVEFESDTLDSSDSEEEGSNETPPSGGPVRHRQPPSWLSDYEW